MTFSARALRCLSCGYDVASLIAQRGRNDPGVCPECGASIRAQLHNPCVYEVQHAWTMCAYTAWVFDSIVRPSKVARLTYVPAAGRIVKWNAVAASVVALIIGSGFMLGPLWASRFDAIPMHLGWTVLAGVMTWVIVWLTVAVLGFILVGACAVVQLKPVWPSVFASLDIASVWLVFWPVCVYLTWLGFRITHGLGWFKHASGDAMLVFSMLALCLAPTLTLARAICILIRFADRFGGEV